MNIKLLLNFTELLIVRPLMITTILESYGIHRDSLIEPLNGGLINQTWKVADGKKQFILQQINNHVFKKPYDVAANIRMIDEYFKEHSPYYLFVSPISNLHKEDIVYEKDQGYFRLFPFIEGSHTIDIVSTPDQAYEAAFQFGKFTQLLSRFEAGRLNITIPDFHNLTLRYRQFETSLEVGNAERIRQSRELVAEFKKRTSILDEFEMIKKSKEFKMRVTHHDTKISNVLFNDEGKGMCVIDLDTIMPGYFISDVGDMMRTYLSPANEEVSDFNKIDVRDDFFRGIVQGYVTAMGDELTSQEQRLILYSGSFLIYMQALRFLTDYFNNDIYYGAKYEQHNFIRAGNQLALLKKMEEKKEALQAIILKELH